MNDTPARDDTIAADADGAQPRRRWPPGAWTRIPAWVYSDPGIYALEQQRIFEGPSWSYGALEAEIPEAGDYVLTSVGEKSVVVVRDADGGVRAFANNCAHRGVAFVRRPRGRAAEGFTCPYHQWSYDLQGRVTGIPFRRGYKGQGGMPPDFSLDGRGAPPLQVARRHGVIFLSFDPQVEPLEAYLGAMLHYFDRVFDGRRLQVLGYTRQRIHSNWKLMFENLKDPFHASVLHVFLISFGLFRMDQPSAVEMDATGRHSALISRRGGQADEAAAREMKNNLRAEYRLQDPRLLEVVREYPGEATVVMQTIWPNLIVQQQSNTLAMRQIVPRGPGVFDLNWTFFGYADDTPEMTQRRIRQANLMGPAGLVSVDDSEVLAMSQQGLQEHPDHDLVVEMGGRDVQDQQHMITEVAIRAFYKHYIEVMGL